MSLRSDQHRPPNDLFLCVVNHRSQLWPGLALAEFALSQGDRVIAAVRDLSKLPASVKAAEPFQLDMDWSQEEIKAAGLKALDIHGHIDILVNMAGYGLESLIEEIDATKAALDSLAGTLAQEVASWNIRVLIVQPGFFQTNWFDTAATMAEAARKDSANDTKDSVYSDLHGQSGRLPSFFSQ
ncbi:hypothetical protein EVG20_g37 [Dentipellis fragilis]|uniref:NAD(P)-binding domain-containing protein n=1 Tax=Dentipellis fragilis TaxID=205917 RepID=A0A4Y9ZGN8_9AGAM|nr:hypothetical protein EVG20_g37 [Dentipellis fragilis]